MTPNPALNSFRPNWSLKPVPEEFPPKKDPFRHIKLEMRYKVSIISILYYKPKSLYWNLSQDE